MEGLLEEQPQSQMLSTGKKKFRKDVIERDLKELMAKFGFNPEGDMERQIMATFISNLFSASLITVKD